MSESKLDKDYEIHLKCDEDAFDQKSLKKMGILLRGHQELPDGYKFTSPKLSKNGSYLTAIGKSLNNENDLVCIWDKKDVNSNWKINCRIKGVSRIEAVDFCSDGNIYAVIYENIPPVFFDFDEGKILSKCEKVKIQHSKIISYSYSGKNKHFALITDTYLVVYNIKTGKISKVIQNNAEIKILRSSLIIFIDNTFLCLKYNLKLGKIIENFKIPSIGNLSEIICSILHPQLDCIYYMKKDGIYKLTLNNKEIVLVKKPTEEIINGAISEDCKICMTTNMINIQFYDLETGKDEGYIRKEKFFSFSVNFPQSTLITCDNICIDLTNISDKKTEQSFVWLDKNPEKFLNFTFSPDYKVLLAIIDENRAISYNCITGEVIKKWNINIENWYLACKMVPETSKLGVIATKSYNNITKIWDYLSGTDLSTFENFNVYYYAFSKNGYLLGAGTVEGEEIARVWDLTNADSKSFYYKNHKNKNSLVCLSKSEPQKIIAVAEMQNPIIFDYNSQNIILECTCEVQLSIINDIECNEKNY